MTSVGKPSFASILAGLLAIAVVVASGLSSPGPQRASQMARRHNVQDTISAVPKPSASKPPSASAVSRKSSRTGTRKYVSPDGVFALWYPSSELNPINSDYSTAVLANFKTLYTEAKVPIEIDVERWHRRSVYKLHDARTVDDLRRVMCEPSGVRRIVECKTLSIRGRLWAWALISSTDGEAPGTFVDMRTIVGRRIYFATGSTLLGRSGMRYGLPVIREVLGSVRLNIS